MHPGTFQSINTTGKWKNVKYLLYNVSKKKSDGKKDRSGSECVTCKEKNETS